MAGDTETRLRADLGCDSLDSVEITMLVEDAFEIEFTDDEADGAFAVEKRVSDALALIDSKLAERAPA